MSVRWIVLLALAVLVLPVVSNVAEAEPILRASWNQCDEPQVNQNYTGPGFYPLFISAIGMNGPIGSLKVEVTTHQLPDAWQFFWGGCYGDSFGFLYPDNSTPCPLVGPVWTVSWGADPSPNWDRVTFSVHLFFLTTPFEPDPLQRYTITAMNFDHTQSVVGASDPGISCGGVEQPLCLHGTGYIDGEQSFVLENDYVTWNDPENTTGCPGATQVQSSTWGRVKSIFR